jgi:uncharacterized HAD superfamily protein
MIDLADMEFAGDSNGNRVSPVLNNGVKNFLIDIDGTVSEDIPNEEAWRMGIAEKLEGASETINEWYDQGHIITFFTARTEEHRMVTENWLKQHGFKYHGLLMNKPRGGNYDVIDNHMFVASHYQGKWDQVKQEVDQAHIEPYEYKFH